MDQIEIIDKQLKQYLLMEIPFWRQWGHSVTSSNAAPPATHHCLLYPKWPTGSGNKSNPLFMDTLNNIYRISFLILSFLLLWEPQKSKMTAKGPKGFWAFPSPFFDLSTPSMRKDASSGHLSLPNNSIQIQALKDIIKYWGSYGA